MNENEATSLLALAEQAASELVGLDARRWRERLELRVAELGPAVEWFLQRGRGAEALRLTVSLPYFWMAVGRYGEGRALLEQVLAASNRAGDSDRATGYFHAGMLAFWQGEDADADRLFRRGLELGRSVGNPNATAMALTGLARIALRESNIDQARALCAEALEVCASDEQKLGRSNALHVLGVTAQMAGDFEQARKLMTARLALAREVGNFVAVAAEAANLSMVERQLGNLTRAEELAGEATELADRLGDEWSVPYNLNAVSAIAAERGDLERAATLLGAAEAALTRQGADWPPDEREHFEHTRARLIDGLDPANLERCWQRGASWRSPEAISYALDRSPTPGG